MSFLGRSSLRSKFENLTKRNETIREITRTNRESNPLTEPFFFSLLPSSLIVFFFLPLRPPPEILREIECSRHSKALRAFQFSFETSPAFRSLLCAAYSACYFVTNPTNFLRKEWLSFVLFYGIFFLL